MFEALVQRLLNQILGEYIQNFSAQNLKIGIWSGEVILKNVVLKKSIIKKLNLPFKIKYSRLGSLKMNIPWKTLTSSKIQVVLEGFEIVIAELPISEWDCKNNKIIEERKKQIESFCQAILDDFAKKAEKSKQKNEDGYFSKLVVKIIDNLQVAIRDIHIRYEDEISKAYSFGVTLQEFKLYTVNTKGQPEYIDRSKQQYSNQPLRKRLELYNIGLYWNEKSQFYSEATYQAKMGSTIAKRGQNTFNHNYVILMSSQATLLQREPGKQFALPQIDLQIDLENLKIEITNTQLQQIISIAERLQKYTKKVKEQNRHILSQQQSQTNKEFFVSIFPEYYDGFGKKLSAEKMQRLQQILQKTEVQTFKKQINQFMQQKEKERILKQKKQKSKGWFWGKPKQISAKEIEQIQNYLNDNFGQEVSIVKRSPDYYYIKVGFKLQKLEVVIANTLAIVKEGIQANFDDLSISFCLREGGYALELTLQNIAVNMFKQIGVDPKQLQRILYKLHQEIDKNNSYCKMVVVGNPIDKKHINTEIKLNTSEIIVLFDPKIISIATDFADLNLSKENKEAAIQKFGQIKEITQTAVSQTMEKPSKTQIGVDIAISSVTVVVPFSPHNFDSDCWGLNLGCVHINSDPQILLSSEISQNFPLDAFNLELTKFSFKHYKNCGQLIQSMASLQKYENVAHAVVDNLNFLLRVEIYSISTDTQSKLKLIATLPSLLINLNTFTYQSILKIANAFETQQKIDRSRQTARIEQKKEIQQKSAKIGFVYIKDSITKGWKRYVAIMSQNYIYLFLNKADKDYYAYYYIKGAKLQKYSDPLDKQKPFLFKIKNKVNQVVFGFDKQEQIEDWIVKINNLTKEKEDALRKMASLGDGTVNSVSVQQKRHNQLNLFVIASIESIEIKVYTTQSLTDKVINLKFGKLSSEIRIHQSKKIINLKLFSLELLDTLTYYKNRQLIYFLQTKHSQIQNNLINIHIEQLNKDHPDFSHTDSAIDINFGTLNCNYKCETVKKLMQFFIPPPEEKPKEDIIQNTSEIDITNTISTVSEATNDSQNYSLKLNLKINQISVTLVNNKIKTIIGILGISNMNLYTGISNQRTSLIGSLKDLYYIDATSYPNTIYIEQEEYPNKRYILTANIGQDKNMLDFNIEILKVMNQYRQNMIIDLKLNNLTTYFVQQPILRLITYLNTQMLPSFETGPAQNKVIVPKDSKPQPSTMYLNVQLVNISVFVQTQHMYQQKSKQQYMQLNIGRITVNNQSVYRQYIRVTPKKPIVLVQNYLVKLESMSISVHYFDINAEQHLYKLTNNLDLTVSTDLIANPQYYKKQIPDAFDNGLRLSCSMTPFFMRINQHDYNFIMKCLNWAITHNDGLEADLFDLPSTSQAQVKNQPNEKDPFYLKVTMDCLSLFIVQDNFPIAFLKLDEMAFNFNNVDDITQMDLSLNSLYGTSIEHDKQKNTLNQKGIFNQLGFISSHPISQIKDLQTFISRFDRHNSQQKNKTNFLYFSMITTERSTDITINMQQLCIDVDVRLLMILSTIANTDQTYIKGPSPIKNAQIKEMGEKKQMKSTNKKFTLLFNMSKLIGTVSDTSKQKFAMIEGEINFNMINYGDKTIAEIQQIYRQKQRSISHSSMSANLKNFKIYFSKIREGKMIAKRDFLQPMEIDFDQKKYYHCQKDIHLLETSIKLKTTHLELSASLRDLLSLNKILQDNLKVLAEFQVKPKEEKAVVGALVGDVEGELRRLEEKMLKEIQLKTKVLGEVGGMQIEIVNDCGNNFMPVLRLMVEETQPALQQTAISTELFLVPILTLYFFNPRSSRWEPIIEPFKTSISYNAITLNQQQSTSLTLKTNSLQEESSSLKVNISTQMLSTVMAAREVIEREQKKLERQEDQSIEISPFVFHNVTNEKVYILRGGDEYEMSPLFKGPVRIPDEKEITFRIRNKVHRFSSDHYGVLKIPDSKYLIRFDTEKLNRIIEFLPPLFIRNKLQQSVYIRCVGSSSDLPRKVEVNGYIPLDSIEAFALSLNSTSYTEQIPTKALKLTGFLLAEKKNFLVLLRYREKLGKYAVVELLPPFVVHNCLPKSLSLQFLQKAKTKSTISVPSQQSYSIFTSEDVNSLEVKALVAGYTWSKKFHFRPDKDSLECGLELSDEGNNQTLLNYVFRREKHSGQYLLTVYCKKIIVNELCDKLLVFGSLRQEGKQDGQQFKLLGGQGGQGVQDDDKIVMVGEEVGDRIRVCGSHSVVDFATPISVGGLGSSQARIVIDRELGGKQHSLFSVVGVEISAIKMSKQCDIFCKKIVLRSKRIIINSTQRDLVIREELAKEYEFTTEAGTRKNFVFGLPDIEGKQNRYLIKSKGFLPSKPLTLPTQGTVYFKLTSEQQQLQQVFFKIYVKDYQSYSFYQINQISSEDFPYEVVVRSANLSAFIPALNKTARRGEAVRFINEGDESGEHIVDIVVSHSESKDQIRMRVCPDNLKFKEKELLSIERGGLVGNLAVVVEVTLSDKQRSIVVDELSRAEEEKEIQQSAIAVDLAEIILSINQNSESVEAPFESMVVTLRRLQFIKYQTDKKRQFQLKLGFLQIDQAYPYIISSPVILTPYKYQEFTREKDPKAIFNFTIVFSKQFSRNTFISEVCVDFNDIVATFSADFINLVTMISSEFGEVINFKEETYFLEKRVERWQETELPGEAQSVFIKSIKIAPFVIDLSAELNIKKLNLQNNLLLTTIMSTVGVVMSNIDSAPIDMTGIQISDCIDTVDSISAKLITHYKQTCIKQFYKIFGSLNIIGNPLSLFRNISTGVKDLREKPAKGFVNGPAEFGLGIVEGTGSLVAHSVGGAFNSISKVTGTVSTGLATLAFDKQFEEHREKEKMKKPQNVIQGLHKGGKAIFYGFKEGITGVFTQPIENARKEGALGFVKGAAKGLAGLVVKPVTGIIDFASKTTEGIKNNALMFEDKAHEERMRYPRVFYSECFILKEYSRRDSEIYSVLKKVDNEQKFPNPVFVDAFQSEGDKLLIILQSGVVYLDVSSRKIKWGIDYSQLQLQENKGKSILCFKKKGKSSGFFSSDNYDVLIEEADVRGIVADLILSLQKQKINQ